MNDLRSLLVRLVESLERLSPAPLWSVVPPSTGDAFIWHTRDGFEPVRQVSGVTLELLKGIDHQRGLLYENTYRFARGFTANNVLLWGARGMGKSALVKAVHRKIVEDLPETLVLVEILREDIHFLPQLQSLLRTYPRRSIIFCDDLSFESTDKHYNSLKTILEGGLEDAPRNVLFYVTSNRRHLISRTMIENESVSALMSHEVIDEKVSLADRFGLWIGFQNCDRETYLSMVFGYAEWLDLDIKPHILEQEALSWAMARGGRSGRIAWQFIQDLTGRFEKSIS